MAFIDKETGLEIHSRDAVFLEDRFGFKLMGTVNPAASELKFDELGKIIVPRENRYHGQDMQAMDDIYTSEEEDYSNEGWEEAEEKASPDLDPESKN